VQQAVLHSVSLTSLISVNVTFITRKGERRPIRAKVGDNVLYLAHRYGIELEGQLWIVLRPRRAHAAVDDCSALCRERSQLARCCRTHYGSHRGTQPAPSLG
jgi:hypothetical protein